MFERICEMPRPPRTARTPPKTRGPLWSGRHQGVRGPPERDLPVGPKSSPSGSAISSGIAGKGAPARGTPACMRGRELLLRLSPRAGDFVSLNVTLSRAVGIARLNYSRGLTCFSHWNQGNPWVTGKNQPQNPGGASSAVSTPAVMWASTPRQPAATQCNRT